MKIIRINTQEKSSEETKEWWEHDLEIEHFAPAALSAFTSMKLARHIKNETPQAVMVDSFRNAMAAVSARELTDRNGYKIIYTVNPNTQTPKSIPGDIKKGVDAWIFASRRLHDAYPADLRNKSVVMPVNVVAMEIERKTGDGKPIITWIGDINDAERLKRAIEEADEHGARFSLRIAGAGLAKIVMPLVRMARGIRYPGSVEWAGEEYRIEEELSRCTCLLRTADDITINETIALQNHIPLIEPTQISDYLDGGWQPVKIDASKETFFTEMRRRLC